MRRTSKALLNELADFIEDGEGGFPRFEIARGRAFDILAHEILVRTGRRPGPLEHPFIPDFYNG